MNKKKPLVLNSENFAELISTEALDARIKTTEMLFNGVYTLSIGAGVPAVIDSLNKNETRVCEWIINAQNPVTTGFYTVKVLAQHDGTDVDWAQYCSIGTSFISLSVDISGNDFRLIATSTVDNTVIRVTTTGIGFS